MIFPTTVFAVFFATVFALHWVLPQQGTLRKVMLLAASLFFYGWWSWEFALMLLTSALVNHAFAVRIAGKGTDDGSRRWIVFWAVALNLFVLAVFKYTGFLVTDVLLPLVAKIAQVMGQTEAFVDYMETNEPTAFVQNIVLPVGISFYTFQALSYIVDVARKDIVPAGSWLDFANYLAFFPQLVAGPIVRAKDLLPQMETLPCRVDTRIDTGRAATLVLGGLFKKMVLANWLAVNLADPVFGLEGEWMFDLEGGFGALDTYLGVCGYTMQIYCDFSAYSDIAIGTALLLGFRFPVNFNAPYLATSLQEFWRRWHISLSGWLRDYLYIPLGGSRAGTFRTYRNLFLTMLLGGLWHGAGWAFLIWGAVHGTYLAFERVIRRLFPALFGEAPRFVACLRSCLGWLLLIHVVMFAWVLFRSGSAEGLETFNGVLAGFSRTGGESLLATPTAFAVLGIAFATQFLDGQRARRLWAVIERLPAVIQGLLAALVFALILGLAPEGVQPFIYFQF